ncbi:lipopolysaccharide biosynthesis protein [Microvirga splendida]|uniref:Lipopolysaccharide biosynthesis protein n=1 Tax=Microvirga splendida TaxID=2795727 RepID=A0ABS0Y8A7_9HYPH|nr:lipopolysaccharide biosynthesis protein [Microvirga splendida]MBJ6128546.1 lipopolysaccharide biosynthesis protein [Microvirga splendida]
MKHTTQSKLKSENTVSSDTVDVTSSPSKLPSQDSAKSRFIVNVSTNVASVVVSTLLMLWYVPFLMRNLGAAAYGMILLANSLVIYASIVSASLDVSISRFLAIDLNQGKQEDANRTFNTALALSITACAALLIPAAALTYYYPALFDIPPGMELETQFLFASIVITLLFSVVSGNFGVSSLIKHRFDLRNIVLLTSQLTRTGIVVLCFSMLSPSLWWVAVAFIISACVNLVGDVIIWKALTPQLSINPYKVDRCKVQALLGLGGWASVNQIGNMLLWQIDLLVINTFFGAEMTGRYGSVMLFVTLILTMTETLVSVLSPAIMARYAVSDIEGLKRIAIRSVKLLGLGLALPVGLLCGLGRPLLTLWLGPEFADLDLILILLVGHLSVNLAVRPLVYVLTAYNRVKVQALLALGLGVGNLALAVSLAYWGGWGAAGVAAASAIVWTVRNVLLLSSYSASVMGLKWWAFFVPLTFGMLGTLGITVVGRLASEFWWPGTWLELGMLAFTIAASYGVISIIIFLNRDDRTMLWGLLPRRLHD